MTRFLQKFDQLPKLSLGGELGGASINGKFAELTAPTWKKTSFYHFSSMLECLPSYIPAALKMLLPHISLAQCPLRITGGSKGP
jgi:hypothetical protein